jgi:hypothetical protein
MYHDDDKNVYMFGMHRWLPIDNIDHKKTGKMGEMNPKNLLFFDNGVYDLNSHQFRNGNKLDFCTLCTNYNFTKITTNKLNDYIHSVFPDKEDYIYFIKTIYLLFRGDSYIVYNIQSLNSGVSTLYKLISLMFVEYFYSGNTLNERKIHTSVINGKWLSKNYKGRCLSVEYLDNFDYNLPILTTIEKINLPNARELKFKAEFDGSGKYIDTHKLAPELMLKMIQLHQSLPNKLLFSHVEGLDNDIIWYIYQLYDIQLFL